MESQPILNIIELPEDLHTYKKGDHVSIGNQALKELKIHYKDLNVFHSSPKIIAHLDLSFFKKYSTEFLETFRKNTSEYQTITDLRNAVNACLASKYPDRNRATELMVQFFMRDNYVYAVRSDDKDELWIYKDGIYIPDGVTYITEFVREVMQTCYTTQLKNVVVEKIKADNYINKDDFFNFNENIDFLPVQNGLLNIKTFELQSFNPNKIFFSKLPMIFDPNAKCEAIKKFIEDICGDKSDIETIRQFIGSCLLRENRFEKMLMCIGGGRNGKTKLADLIKRFLGVENVSGLQPSSFENPESFQTYLLHGKLVNMYMDISKTAFKNTSLLKSLSGRDTISVPRKYKTPLTFTNSCKFIFGANDLPMSYDISSGFWQRWLLISLPYTFIYKKDMEKLPEDEKHKYKERIDDIVDRIVSPEELSGFLNWVLGGLHKLLENNSFSYKYTAEEVQTIWVRESDSFAAFFMDCCVYEYDAKIEKKELKKAYAEYCKEHHLKILGDKKIKHYLEEQGAFDLRVTENNVTYNAWENISFKEIYRKSTDAIGLQLFQSPSKKDKVMFYVQHQKTPRLQDVKMRFGNDVVDKLLEDGTLIKVKDDTVRANI